MIRRSLSFALLAALVLGGALFGSNPVAAQNQTVLAEIYGQGVHAYYSGRFEEAYDYFTQAIDGGTRDPRVYFFRGICDYSQGKPSQAESDWEEGARLEAQTAGGAGVGQALSRFQGSARLKLEGIRQKARLNAMLNAESRSDIRMNQLGGQPAPAAPPAATTPPASASPAPPAPTAPAADNPFADDGPAMAGGNAKVEDPNALEGLDAPLQDDSPLDMGDDSGMAAGTDAGNPFGEPAPADTGSDPFGTDAGADPFGAPPAAGNDPFGGDPFGN
jgi:hypothetical protein